MRHKTIGIFGLKNNSNNNHNNNGWNDKNITTKTWNSAHHHRWQTDIEIQLMEICEAFERAKIYTKICFVVLFFRVYTCNKGKIDGGLESNRSKFRTLSYYRILSILPKYIYLYVMYYMDEHPSTRLHKNIFIMDFYRIS